MRFRATTILVVAILALTATTSIPPHPADLLARQDYRLPLEVTPETYQVHLTPFLDNATFAGRVVITATPNVDQVTTITLHVHPSIDVKLTTVHFNEQTIEVTVPPGGSNPTNDFFVITLHKAISLEGTVVVEMDYSGVLNEDMVGFYRSSYLNADGKTEYLAATQFEATDARMAFPCFDEPGLKATFELIVTAPPGYSVLGNTPLAGQPSVNDRGWFTFTFEQTPPMSTYLLATVVSKFDSSSTSDVSNQVWSRPTASGQRNYTKNAAASIMGAVIQITGVPYATGKITKMDNVAVPDFRVGAMENWGLVTYRQTRLLVDESETPMSMRKQVAGDLAHEYGHQFFGDLVTPRWWNFIWLNEAFASYTEYHANALVEPTWRMDEQFVVDEVHQALYVDSLITTRAMTVDEDSVLSKAQISAIFDDIAYAKGGSIVRMVEHILGTEIFRKGLKNYLTKMALKAATQDDLFDAMAEVAGILPLGGFSLREILQSWTNTVGYPLLTVTRDYENNTASVIQTRFLISGSLPTRPTWITPVNWATSLEDFKNTRATLWLNQQETLKFPMEEPLLNSSTWVVVNNYRTGFYRVNYDEDNWRMLTDQLLSNHSVFPPVTQAQLLDDGFALARSGKLNYSVALGLTLYLEEQDDLIPWIAALNSFSYIKDRLTGSSYYEYFQKYMHKIMGHVFRTFDDFTPPESSEHTERLLISKIVTWECQLGNQKCSDQSKSLVQKVNDQGISEVPADVRAAVYCEAVRSGDTITWDKLWTHYMKTVVASEEMLVLQALACSTDEETLKQLLLKTTTKDSSIRKQDYRTVYTSVCNNPDAFNVLTQFVDDQVTAGNTNGMIDIVMCLASKVNSEDQRFTIKNLADRVNVDVSRITDENVQWLQLNEETVGEWLKKYSNSAGTAKLTAFGILAAILVAAKSILGQ